MLYPLYVILYKF